MIRRLFGQSPTVASAAIIVAAFSLLSRVFGFVRDHILSGVFGGKSAVLDAYFAAFRVPDFLFQLLVVGAISASFIPVFVHYYAKDDDRAWRMTSNVLTVLLATFAVLAAVVSVFAPAIVPLIVPGYTGDKLALVISMTRVMFVGQTLFAISMVFGSVLQGTRRFFLYSVAPIVNNVGIIIGAVAFVPIMGPIGLAWGTVLGAALHAATQAIGVVMLGFRYTPMFSLRDPDLVRMARQMIPRVMGLAVNQINFVAMTSVASFLVDGSNGLLQFAYNLNFLPVGVVAVSYAIAMYPTLCAAASEKRRDEFRETFSSTVRQVLLFMIPATVFVLLLRAQIVRVVLGGHNFDWVDTIRTANLLGVFALSFVPQSLVYVLVRAYFAHEDTMTPFLVGLGAAIVNLVAAHVLANAFDLSGLGIAFSVASFVQFGVLWALLRVKLGSLDERRILRSTLLLGLAGLAAGGVTEIVKYAVVTVFPLDRAVNVVLEGAIAGGAGLVVFTLVAIAVKSPEMLEFARGMRRKLIRQAQPAESAELTS